MLLRLFNSLILLICISFNTYANQSASKTFTGSLLWIIDGKDLAEPSYILGSHHMISIHMLDSIPGFSLALNCVKQVAGEIVLSDLQEIAIQIQQAGQLPDGISYRDYLSEEESEMLDMNLKNLFNVGMDQLGNLHPAIINIMIATLMQTKYNPDFIPTADFIPIDQYIQIIAHQEDKLIIGLETVEEELIALFHSEPLDIQMQDLICQLSNMDYMEESIKEFTLYYRKGQLDEIYKFSFDNKFDPCPASEEYKHAILKERNDKWLEKLPQIMGKQSTLIVVGALHLAGEEGLLYQLHQQGYTIKAVKD